MIHALPFAVIELPSERTLTSSTMSEYPDGRNVRCGGVSFSTAEVDTSEPLR